MSNWKKCTLINYTDGKTEWWSLLVDNIFIARKAVNQIIGGQISDMELDAHSIYINGHSIVNIGTAKMVFKSLCEDLYKNRSYVMNYRGGHFPLEYVDWKELGRETFEFESSSNLRNLLLEKNGKLGLFKKVEA